MPGQGGRVTWQARPAWARTTAACNYSSLKSSIIENGCLHFSRVGRHGNVLWGGSRKRKKSSPHVPTIVSKLKSPSPHMFARLYQRLRDDGSLRPRHIGGRPHRHPFSIDDYTELKGKACMDESEAFYPAQVQVKRGMRPLPLVEQQLYFSASLSAVFTSASDIMERSIEHQSVKRAAWGHRRIMSQLEFFSGSALLVFSGKL
ncbi:hypothetical protein ANN_07729 [Periplaneta americana]|uniref:Uncharacterized protein n=1 Tax=Periplaneta americana TaxID=6978 RepID=A0ABQ8SZF8_PERAM|nr:hypothetical protein ANN_07729 [Periplaneta americana]